MDQHQQGAKRKAEDGFGAEGKRSKTKKQWRVPRGKTALSGPRAIMPGDSGIFATCNKGRESKCVGELRDLFSEYATQLYGDKDDDDDNDDDGGATSIENDIQAELAGIQKPAAAPLFVPVKLDVQCVVFFKTIAPVEPVSFVQKICEDAMAEPMRKRTRTAKRLAPMTLMGKATMEGLESVAKDVLAPHFHQAPVTPKKFAVRPNMRNHNTLKRDAIIKMIAGLVGQPHKVDLKNYDLLITVEIYQNICGVSVVDHRFEELKRYNISEIFDPSPKEQEAQVVEKAGDDEAKEQEAQVVEKAGDDEAKEQEAQVVEKAGDDEAKGQEDEKVVVAAETETGKEVVTDAKPVDDNGGISAAKDGEASVSEATMQGQGQDETGVSQVQDEVKSE